MKIIYPKYYKRMLTDIALTVAVFAILATALVYSDSIEWWWSFTRAHEHWELDEVLAIVIAFLCSVAVLAVRGMFVIADLLKKQIEHTEQIKQMQAAQRQKGKLESLGVMSSGISHEIKNALQPIIGLGELLQEQAKKNCDEQSIQHLKTIIESAEYATRISKKVLAFSRGEKSVVTEIADILPQLAQVSNHMANSISPHITVINDFERHKGLEMPVRMSAEGLVIILMNLVLNAQDAMGGTGTITIDLIPHMVLSKEKRKLFDLDKDKDYCGITVADTGCGISPESIEKIFDPFFTTKSEAGNSGLGLSTIYGFVKDVNGAIDVQSTVGEGTRFTIILPIVK